MADVKHEEEVIIEEELAIVPTKRPPVADVPMEAGKSAVDTIYDHYQKKLYVFDRSGSMGTGMMPEEEASMYKWTPEILQNVRGVFVTEGFLYNAALATLDMAALDDEEYEQAKEDIDNMTTDELWVKAGITDDELFKKHLVAQNLLIHPKIEPLLQRDYGFNRTTERKIEAVRGAMKKFVEQRFKKYPDAQVGVIGFGDAAHIMCYPGAPKPEVLTAVQALDADYGGTNILKAIKAAMTEFKRSPSHVGSHHIVMVTDGQDWLHENDVDILLHNMKERNVVFDFIYVVGYGYSARDDKDPKSTSGLLRKLCTETGGEYQVVSKSSDFEEKFLKASNRLALPPAGRL